MSMDSDSPQLRKTKRHETPKDTEGAKSKRKRKRQTSDELSVKSAKKPKTKHRLKSPTAQESPSIRVDATTESPLYEQASSLYLPLPPISQRHALQGLCAEHLSPLILTYYPPFHGVIISYSNPRLSSDPDIKDTNPAYAKSVDEYAPSFIWVTADFLVFRPEKGRVVEGYVNLQNESNLGLVCWNFFNASIERKKLPKGWKWIAGGVKPGIKRKLKNAVASVEEDSEDDDTNGNDLENNVQVAQGYFQDERGMKVEGLVRFRVKDVETSRSMDRETSFLNIKGTMLGDEEEKVLQGQEAMRLPNGRGRLQNGNVDPRNAMSGALMDVIDSAMDIDSTSSLIHAAKY